MDEIKIEDLKIEQIREMQTSDLNEKIYELKQVLLTLRFKHATGQLANGKDITKVRKTIARCYTVLKEHEIGIN